MSHRYASNKNKEKQLLSLKEQVYCLQKASWDKNLPVIVLLEGWETIRKSSLIRALTEPLDPRGFVFHAIRSPLPHEKARPWMWRFWMKIPERGQWAIFDQSWYRRVLLERLREKISERELRRALRDINDFERTLSDDGTLILKFFLHTEKSQYKLNAAQAISHADTSTVDVTDARILSRRYDQLSEIYEAALRHTQQDWAPWTVIPADDKRTARLTFLKTIVKKLQQNLGIDCLPDRAATTAPVAATKPRAAKKTKVKPAEATPSDHVASEASPAAAVQTDATRAAESDEDAPQSEAGMPEKPADQIQQFAPDESQEPDENASEAAAIPAEDELP